MQDPQDTRTVPMSLAEAGPQGFHVLPMDLIDTRENVRLTSGLDDSLDELAESIKAVGLLQPVTVRACGARYVLIAGHRRLFALQLAGIDLVPSIVMEADEDTALQAQIAENIQRENLSMLELSRIVAKLHAKHKSLGKVAEVMKKSKPWVCKYLAFSRPDVGKWAKRLLEEGMTEDVEIAVMFQQFELVIRQIEGIDSRAAEPLRKMGTEVLEQVKTKKAKRKDVKAMLDKAKAIRQAQFERSVLQMDAEGEGEEDEENPVENTAAGSVGKSKAFSEEMELFGLDALIEKLQALRSTRPNAQIWACLNDREDDQLSQT